MERMCRGELNGKHNFLRGAAINRNTTDFMSKRWEKLIMKFGFDSPEEERKFIISEGMPPYEVKCAICGDIHYQGKGCYPLRRVSGYELFCCKICYDGNWDGWNPRYEAKLLEHLRKIGVNPPPRNEEGLLPREF